jgi:parallel beta-helix repeat protein
VLVVGLSALAMVSASPAQAATCVQLQPSIDVAATINTAPAGSQFCFAPGVYRLTQTITPRAGVALRGQPGAVISGARAVTGFTRSGSTWVAGGQTQAPTTNAGAPGDLMLYPQAQYNQNVYMDGRPLWKVGVRVDGRTIGESAESVGPGEYFFDYDADEVYIGDDPTGRSVDATNVAEGISSAASGVTVSGLTVEGTAGIGIRAMGAWTIEGNDVRLHAHKGIVALNGTRVLRNTIHHNGAYGITGQGANIVVQGNEVAFNNVSRLDTIRGSCNANGGSKFVETTGIVIRGNNFHDNYCNAIWLDIGNHDSLVEGNRAIDNLGQGITVEISYNAVVRGNVVAGNDDQGIIVRDSPNVDIVGNTIRQNSNGPVVLVGKGRTDHPSSYGPHVTKNVLVHGNTMTVQDGSDVKVGGSDETGGALWHSGNRFFDNTYRVESADTKAFRWNGSALTWSQWRGIGFDTAGTLSVMPAR